MYSEWASLQQEIQSEAGNTSVLHKFPDIVGKDVASSVVKTLAKSLSMATTNEQPSNLHSDKDVDWTMEILCYSLSLPLSESSTMIECVNVYCEWLSAFTEPKVCVPSAIKQDPNQYGQHMLQHLQNLFVPRAGSTPEQVSRQVVHCHRVLRVVQSIAHNSTVLTRQTWDCMLKFLLAINDSLLGPPASKESLGDQICDRAISVLFEVLLLACYRSFPSPPMWKTLHDMCCQWRHHEAVVVHWHHVNVALMARVMRVMCGPNHPVLNISEDEASVIPEGMSDDCVAQCWFRFLHILQNPVDLARPAVIANTPKFLHHALTNGLDPEHHPCLGELPHIFHQAMRSVAVLVDALLGLTNRLDIDLAQSSVTKHSTIGQPGSTPPPQRKSKSTSGGKGFRPSISATPTRPVSVSSVSSTFATCTLNFDLQSALTPTRPKVNSMLHLFGAWLIEAALVGVKGQGTQPRDEAMPALSRSRTTSFHVEHNPSLVATSGSSSRHSTHLPDDIAVATVRDGARDQNEAGRAEACGTLCRIFCSKRTREEILPEYLSRFYFVLYHGLNVEKPSGLVLTSIVCHSCDLLRLDLAGVMMLLPHLLTVLEQILPDLAPKFRHDEHIGIVELRKASIHILLSMLCLPLHFKTQTIQPLLGTRKEGSPAVTFLSLKMRMMELLLRALTVETEPGNTQMLLGGLLLCVQDLALCEEAEQTMQQEEQDSQGMTTSLGPDTAGSNPLGALGSSDGQICNDAPLGRASKDFDSAQGLFCHAASIVSNRLLASWKLDLNIALAAMEVLSGLAKVRLNRVNFLMGKRTVNWICEFILYQCSRPAPSHSKDLHSMIVAAFQCLSLWLVEHSYLMQDKECLQGVLEVLELGISGAKSQDSPVSTLVLDPSLANSPRSPILKRNSPNSGRKFTKQEKEVQRLGDPKRDTPDFKSPVSSQNRASDTPKFKGDKTLKPVSLRVKDAAEGLLTVIMDHVGSFPPPCGPESLCSLLDEESLLSYCKDGDPPDLSVPFKYYVVEGSTLIGLYEQPLGNNQDPLPTVTALIRGPFGRHAWTMQLRHQPRSQKTESKAHLTEVKRPKPVENLGKIYNVQHRCFPTEVDQVPLVQADRSISRLESSLQDQSAELERFKTVILNQTAFEETIQDKLKEESSKQAFPNPRTECEPPSVSHDLQTARLFLSHFGFLTLDALKSPANSSRPPALVALRPGSVGLPSDLAALDMIPCRTSDTVHVFYVRARQTSAVQILSNVTRSDTVQPAFLEFLRALGWPVDVRQHAGWTGHVSTSWKIQNPPNDDADVYPGDTGGSLYDGQQQVLYWADVSTEIAFVVPSPTTYSNINRPQDKSPKLHHSASAQSSEGGSLNTDVFPPVVAPPSSSPRLSDPANHNKLKSVSLDLEGPPPDRHAPSHRTMTPTEGSTSNVAGPGVGSAGGRRFGRGSMHVGAPESKIFVVWLENYEDWQTFPSGDLLAVTSTGVETSNSTSSVSSTRQMEQAVYIIYIHPLQNGLYRIHMQGQPSKMSLAIPLVDGMVVSRRTLGSMVRQTASNICRRKRLESDAYQPPHVRRKHKISDIVEKYTSDLTEAEFYTSLFKNCS